MRAAQQGSLRLYQCHCVLPINLFTEKICSIWWFYVAALLPVTAASLAVWMFRSFAPSARSSLIQRCLRPAGGETDQESLQRCLTPDGFFLLRLIEINHGSAVLQPIVRRIIQRVGNGTANDPPPSVSVDINPIPSPSGHRSMTPSRQSSLRRKFPMAGGLTHPLPFRRMRIRRSLHIHPTESRPAGLVF